MTGSRHSGTSSGARNHLFRRCTTSEPARTWPDDALLLVAHGATGFADAGRLVHVHADALRAQRRFAGVAVGLLNGEPSTADALADLTPHVVHVVPFFMEHWAGSCAKRFRDALGDGRGHELRYHAPVGVHRDMAALAAERVLRVCGSGASGFAVLLVGHGSARAPGRPWPCMPRRCTVRGRAIGTGARGVS